MAKKPTRIGHNRVNGRFKKGFCSNPGGRPKGTKDKATEIKIAFYEAFEKIGGLKTLVDWASKNRNKKEYYKILASMLPKDIDLTVPDETLKMWEDVKADALISTAAKLAREVSEITRDSVCNKEAEAS